MIVVEKQVNDKLMTSTVNKGPERSKMINKKLHVLKGRLTQVDEFVMCFDVFVAIRKIEFMTSQRSNDVISGEHALQWHSAAKQATPRRYLQSPR